VWHSKQSSAGVLADDEAGWIACGEAFKAPAAGSGNISTATHTHTYKRVVSVATDRGRDADDMDHPDVSKFTW
jgi:hypothetical protein